VRTQCDRGIDLDLKTVKDAREQDEFSRRRPAWHSRTMLQQLLEFAVGSAKACRRVGRTRSSHALSVDVERTELVVVGPAQAGDLCARSVAVDETTRR